MNSPVELLLKLKLLNSCCRERKLQSGSLRADQHLLLHALLRGLARCRLQGALPALSARGRGRGRVTVSRASGSWCRASGSRWVRAVARAHPAWACLHIHMATQPVFRFSCASSQGSARVCPYVRCRPLANLFCPANLFRPPAFSDTYFTLLCLRCAERP